MKTHQRSDLHTNGERFSRSLLDLARICDANGSLPDYDDSVGVFCISNEYIKNHAKAVCFRPGSARSKLFDAPHYQHVQ